MKAESKSLWTAAAAPSQGPLGRPGFVGVERPGRGWGPFYTVLTEKYSMFLPVPVSRVDVVTGLCLGVQSTCRNPSVIPDYGEIGDPEAESAQS